MAHWYITQEKLQALRSEYKHRNASGKYPRPKVQPECLKLYPWLLPDETDPSFAFCTVCENRLSARRGDLGKHEASTKHQYNFSKKGLDGGSGLVLKDCHETLAGEKHNDPLDVAWNQNIHSEDQQDFLATDDADGVYIKHEPGIDLIENSNVALNSEELTYDDNEFDDDDEDPVPPPFKQLRHSQHSSTTNDYLPLTINEPSNMQRFSIRELSPAGPYNMHMKTNRCRNFTPLPQTPCKITIKKITAPVAAVPAYSSHISAATSAMPVPTQVMISQQPTKSSDSVAMMHAPLPSPSTTTQYPHNSPTHALRSATFGFRDSYELFFDSICASVKALPPKLATEGKIRVMQLIGELEMRAITEQEAAALAQEEVSGGLSQQNATVASSTTK